MTPDLPDPQLELALMEVSAQASRSQQESATVTGSRGGNAALANLLTALAKLGIIEDNTTAS